MVERADEDDTTTGSFNVSLVNPDVLAADVLATDDTCTVVAGSINTLVDVDLSPFTD